MEKQSNCCLAVKEASKESDIQVGHRIEILKERGFVRFIGSLDSPDKDPSILWLGIEWDDHTRGKHYGTYCGKQYFHCKRNKGSFIKLMEVEKNPRKDFMEALLSKYCFDNLEEISHSSNVFRGNKTAEFVGFYKAADQFRNVASLKHIALPGYAIFRAGDHYKLEKGILASAEVLDISNNLFSDFSEILTIIGLAPSLKELILSNNRFEQIAPTLTANRNQIRLLVLNDCFYDSETLMNSLLYFPCVEELHLSQNCFKHDFVPLSSLCPKLKSLFLDACGIQTWEELSCLGTLSSLKKLSLARNNISRLNISTSEDCSDQKYSFKQLEFINLSGNGLKGLRVINELTKLQSLKSLRIDDLVTDNEESVPRFQFIGRLKCLLYLNGSFISDTERRDCEMMYIKYICEQIMQHGVEAGETIFPRFEELKNLYADYFSEKLRELKPILHSQQVVITLVDETNISKTQDWTRKLPCSTPVRKLKQIAAKQFQLRQVDQLVLYYQLKSSNDDSIATFYLDDDSRPLSYFGIENGTVVFIRQRDTV